MRSRGFLLLVVVALAAGAAYWYLGRAESGVATGTTEYKSNHGFAITVTEPTSGATVTSPLKVNGVVPGSWSFEANFPIEIQDADHKKVAEAYGTVIGEWMTEKPVKFTSSIPFKAPVTDQGFLVLHKANPSGDQATDDSVEIPIRFRS